MNYVLPKKLTLDYKTWRCGGESWRQHGEGTTQLLNHQQYMCCLGQFCEQSGVPKQRLLGRYTPQSVCNVGGLLDDRTQWGDYPLVDLAVNINDNGLTSTARKAVKLRKLFGERGYEIELVNFPEEIMEEIKEMEDGNIQTL